MLKPQVRIVLRNCGFIDPDISTITSPGTGTGDSRTASPCPGRRCWIRSSAPVSGSGRRRLPDVAQMAGLPGGRRRRAVSHLQRRRGRPGRFMNRSLIEGDPHAVLEGMLIAAYTIGASGVMSISGPSIPWPSSG